MILAYGSHVGKIGTVDHLAYGGKILPFSLPPLDGVGFRSSCSSSLLPRSDPDEESESKRKISF